MTYFFDTSALFKLFVQEQGTETVVNIFSDINNEIWVSELSRIEFYSTIMRRFRAKQLTKKQLTAILTNFESVWKNLLVISFKKSFLLDAENLIKTVGLKHNMRTLDALQLATYQFQADADWIFLTADRGFANSLKSLKIKII
jgi:uncharacterized protein